MEFVDRVSAYPNRYLMTSEDGSAHYVVLERADEPVTVGTPLNAETLNNLIPEVLPIQRGGTGATSAEAARANLGIGVTEIFNGTFSTGTKTWAEDYNLIIIIGYTVSGNASISRVLPAVAFDGSKYQLEADGDWLTFTTSEKTITISSRSSTGAITKIYGVV